jgi:hypothetical protein
MKTFVRGKPSRSTGDNRSVTGFPRRSRRQSQKRTATILILLRMGRRRARCPHKGLLLGAKASGELGAPSREGEGLAPWPW